MIWVLLLWVAFLASGLWPQFRVISFNAALLHGDIPYAQERLPFIIKALRELRADVVCMQEIWKESDAHIISDSLRDLYPYVSRIPDAPLVEKSNCGFQDLWGLGLCMAPCIGSNDIGLCVRIRCQKHFVYEQAHNLSCYRAMSAGSGLLSIIDYVRSLLGLSQIFMQNGSYGLLFLSSYPFVRVDNISFPSGSIRRGAQLATIDVGKKFLHVLNTHLGANLSPIPYSGPKEIGSWENEQAEHAKIIVETLKALPTGDPILMIGDCNCSFPEAGVKGAWEQNCVRLLGDGYLTRLTSDTLGCTYCRNSLMNKFIDNLGGIGEDMDTRLDQVFVRNINPAIIRIERIFTNPIRIVDGDKKIELNLSDHYGLQVTISMEK